MVLYFFEMLGTAIFAITGVLAVSRRGLDVFGALALGLVTAIGGGTMRDLIIETRVFWLVDQNYIWAATLGALAAFWIGSAFRATFTLLLYLDALGAALFAVTAANRVLALEMSGPIAVIMGVLTGIGGGLIRDVLAGRATLLVSRDIYATPILLGCTVFVILRGAGMSFPAAGPIAFAVIFVVRALAIHLHLEMPAWLTKRED